jgi:hypothetical protein
MTTKLSRRALLQKSLQIPIGVASIATLASCNRGASSGAAGAPSAGTKSASNVCANPQTMDESERSLRQSLHYTEMSADQTTVCGGCALFHAGDAGGCGTCDIYSGRPVNSRGHCDSWSKRPA